MLTYLFTYSMEQSHSWEANRISTIQEIPRVLFNIIFPSTPGSPKWFLPPRFLHQKPAYASPLHHKRYMPRPSIAFILRCFNPFFGSSVGIATAYGLDGPGIESRWGEIFRTSPDRPWGPPNLLYNGYRVFPGGKVLPGRDADPWTPPSADL